MKKFTGLLSSLLSLFIFLTLFTGSPQAVYLNSGNVLNLPKDQKINESAFVAAGDLVIDANVDGDFFCAGRNVTINGVIKGDVICAAQLIKINGTVDGNIRVVAQTVEINGLVNRNVLSLSQSLTLAKFSTVKGDIFFGVQNVDLRGSLGRDLGGAAEQITISGSLLRHAKLAAQKISIIDPAKIGGDFEYFIDTAGTASVNQKNIKGSIIRHEIARPEPTPKSQEVSFFANGLGQLYWFISTLLFGFTLIYFCRTSLKARLSLIKAKPSITGLVGFAFLTLTPLVIILLLMTVIGAPLAFALLLCYLLAIMFATITPIILIGEWLIKLSKKKVDGFSWPLSVGAFAVGLIFLLPWLGAFVGFMLLCQGLGATFLSILPEK